MGIDTYAITGHHALPLLIRRPRGAGDRDDRRHPGVQRRHRHHEGFYYDLVKAAVQRMTLVLSHELAPYGGVAVAVTPGWLRSETMLEAFGVTEDNWREATARVPHFCIAEAPAFADGR
ncbi:hypothetical protein IPZ61_22065 [Streptomyces sioyaensis]|nr:hypothetical protein [Streptomyces sioyaensis]